MHNSEPDTSATSSRRDGYATELEGQDILQSCSNIVVGTVSGLVQAGVIHGGVHLHQPSPVVPRQLPPAPPHFTSRQDEKEALDRITAKDGSSQHPALVVLAGPAGAGKSALALHWLHNNLDRFPDGQLFANFGAFGVSGPVTPSEVLSGFLRALGVRPEDIPLELAGQAALYRSMSAGKALAVLADDAESAAQVRPLLPASPGSVVLTTSRHRLAGLAFDGARFVPVDVLDEASAVTLISRVLGEDKVAREPASTRRLAALCGGLPIALTVAAAWLSVRPHWPISRAVSTLADERRRLASLAVVGDTSVQASLDLSYHRLRPDVARLYRLLGLHPGPEFGLGVTAAAAEMAADDAENLLAHLVDANLLNEVADGRFRFHDLLRLHAKHHAEQHDDAGEREATARRMVFSYLSDAIDADLVVMPLRHRMNSGRSQTGPRRDPFPNAASALDWLERERYNLVAAQRCAADSGAWDLAWRLCDAMWALFLYRKHFELWIAAHQLGIEASQRCGDAVAEATLTIRLGIAYLNLQRYPSARERFAAAHDLSRTADDPRTEATALEHLGLAARRTGEPGTAMSHFVAALAITERLGVHRGTALHLRRIGETLSETGRADEALPFLRRAVTASSEVGDQVLRAQALTRLGTALTRVGDVAAARESLREAVDVLASANSDHYHADAVLALGDLALHAGDHAAARRNFQLALELYDRVRMPRARQVQDRLTALDGTSSTSDQ